MVDILEVNDLSIVYRVENKLVRALDQVSFAVSSGGTLGIVGESGSGKTTLGMGIMNYIESPGKITSGQVQFLGKEVLSMTEEQLRKYRWEEVSMIYQSAMNSLNPVKTVSHPIVEVLRSHKKLSKKEALETTLKMLSELGIKPERAFDYPHEMSGGMRQRIVIALALALSPKLLIADEPTSALDVVTQKQIIDLIKEQINQRGLSLIFITHEIALLNNLVEEIAVMYSGEIVEIGPLKDVILGPLHPYTEMLLSTILSMDSPLKDISDYSKNTATEKVFLVQDNACRYAGRCKYAFDRCSRERPRLRKVDNERLVACHKYN
ncbi:MAG: ABC transporter ATP-binding protein [Nitrososphaerales archaeon]